MACATAKISQVRASTLYALIHTGCNPFSSIVFTEIIKQMTNLNKSTLLFSLLSMFIGFGQLQAQTSQAFGKMKIGTWTANANYGAVAHTDHFGIGTRYSLLQSNAGVTFLNSAPGQNLYFRIGNSSAMTVKSNKRVGIGTTNPQDYLHIQDATYPAMRLAGGGYIAQFALATANGFYSPQATPGDAVLRALHGDMIINSNTGDLRFTTQNNGASERMTLTNAGNLGIGTKTPGVKLDVAGDIRSTTALKFLGGSSPYLTNSGNNLIFSGLALFVGRQNLMKMNFLNQQVNIGSDQSYTPGYVLTVDGKVLVEELKVQNSTNWPDYVFEEDYKLAGLDEVEAYVKENKHLPDVPGADELTDGVAVGEMQKTLLKKVEELTLYMIDLNKTVVEQDAKIKSLEARNAELQADETK